MAKHKIMRGDQVKVIRGNYRDMVGSVLEVYPETARLRVEGVNFRMGVSLALRVRFTYRM